MIGRQESGSRKPGALQGIDLTQAYLTLYPVFSQP